MLKKRTVPLPCTACGNFLEGNDQVKAHPLLRVPVCRQCYQVYHTGEFTLDVDGKEAYCRWCGDGGELLCCDNCIKAFCKGCISRNFGQREVLRILGMAGVWHCLDCNPSPLQDLRRRMACLWGKMGEPDEKEKSSKRKRARAGQLETNKEYLVCEDVARGREGVAIPAINEVDDQPFPLDFAYVTEHVPGPNVHISTNPTFMSCCSCKDNCRDPEVCECAQAMGGSFPYNMRGQLTGHRFVIYECNDRCSCHTEGCKNRTVGRGLQLRLEVFRCEEPAKGWGVRCLDPIPAGTYITDYIGEILREDEAETQGVRRGDEYLFTLDMWASDVARYRLEQLGLKQGYEVDGTPPALPSPPRYVRQPDDEEEQEDDAPSPDFPTLPDEFVGIEPLSACGVSVMTGMSPPPRSRRRQKSHVANPPQQTAELLTAAAALLAPSDDSEETTEGEEESKGNSGDSISSGDTSKCSPSGDEQEEEIKGTSSSSSTVVREQGKNLDGSARALPPPSSSQCSPAAGQRKHPFRQMYSPGGRHNDLKDIPVCGAHLPELASREDEVEYMDEKERKEYAEMIVNTTMEQIERGIGFCIDAKWYGNVARFINHSCEPNLFKQTTFVNSHDVRLPRVAFFAAWDIPAMEELTYDYGYAAGSVAGKTLGCLCGASDCRNMMY